MRAAAKIDKITLLIESDGLISRNCLDQFYLERLIIFFIESHRFIARPDIADNWLVTVNNLMHPFFNAGKIIFAKGLFTMEIIIESIFDCRTDRDLCFREQFQYRFGHDMRAIMTQ